MIPKIFNSSDLQRDAKKVFDAVEEANVIIIRSGSEDMVLTTVERFNKLLKAKKDEQS